MLAAERVQIQGEPGEPVQADGDIIATLTTRIETLPGALELIYPPGREPAARQVQG
jgi:diacylglycerol kinase family enzyme